MSVIPPMISFPYLWLSIGLISASFMILMTGDWLKTVMMAIEMILPSVFLGFFIDCELEERRERNE